MNHPSQRILGSAANRRRRLSRSGAAFVMLVMMLLLVIVAATQSLVRGELAGRRAAQDRLQQRALRAAIESAQRSSTDRLVLPLDESRGERIEVTFNEDQTRITARRLRGEQVIDEMTQSNQNNRGT